MGKIENKRGVSLVLSYVLLIVIVVGISITVFQVLKKLSQVTPTPECPDSVMMSIEDYSCEASSINLTVKNRGLFDIDGFTIRGAVSPAEKPVLPLEYDNRPLSAEKGVYFFKFSINSALKPNMVSIQNFSYSSFNPKSLGIIELEPFVVQGDEQVFCEKAVITKKLDGC